MGYEKERVGPPPLKTGSPENGMEYLSGLCASGWAAISGGEKCIAHRFNRYVLLSQVFLLSDPWNAWADFFSDRFPVNYA